ncbi:MAG: peptidyl-prolyl cis-trans isomerase [Proteobacteria bacterium]|nr:peptidyl-prolyl cis-trans isomerase [Pseudomonadota bacterium]
MKYIFSLCLLLFSIQSYSHAGEQHDAPIAPNPDALPIPTVPQSVVMQTNLGTMVIELNAEKAPKSVDNFVRYVKKGFYDGTIFHRVIDNFMIQGGGFTKHYEKRNTRKPIINEADNGLKNTKGTIAMARTNDPHSATAQFFINAADNSFLDFKAKTMRGWGYTVFGKVTEGMDIIDKIRQVPTGGGGPFPTDVPRTQIIIEKMTMK